MKMIPVNISIKNSDIIFRTGDDKVVYKSDINSFIADSGVTIKNVVFPIESFPVITTFKKKSLSFVLGINSIKIKILYLNESFH